MDNSLYMNVVTILMCGIIFGLILVPATSAENSIYSNQPPSTPIITGETQGSSGTYYTYTFVSVDPEGDNVSFYIDWGDTCGGEWIEPHPSGANATADHNFFREGTYSINSLAVDSHGAESDWGSLEVTMPFGKNSIIFSWLNWIFKHHPLLYQIFTHIIY